MATYDTTAPADPFARSRLRFESLAGDLSGGRAGPMTHDQLGGLGEDQGRGLKRQRLPEHPAPRAAREEQALPAEGEARRVAGRGRVERGHERGLATVFGPVTVRRLAFRAPGRANVYPADAALSLPRGRHSHGLRRLAVREAVRGSYDTAKAAVDRRCGKVAGKRQLEELVRSAACDIDAFYARRTPMPCTPEVPLVLSAGRQGSGMRPAGPRPAASWGGRGPGPPAGRWPSTSSSTSCTCSSTSGLPRGPSTPKTIRPPRTGSPRRPWRCCAAGPGRSPGHWPRRPASTCWQTASERAWTPACGIW